MVFKIGGEDYEVKITYRMRRKWLECFDPKAVKNMTPVQVDDVIIDILMMQLGKVFKNKNELMDALDNDEFKAISTYMANIPVQEDMIEIEKKRGVMSAM